MRDHFPDWVGVPCVTPSFCPSKKNPEIALHIIKKTLCKRPCTCDGCRLENIDRLIGAGKPLRQKFDEAIEYISWQVSKPFRYVIWLFTGPWGRK